MSYELTVWMLLNMYSQSLLLFLFKKHCSNAQFASHIFKFIVYFILEVVWHHSHHNHHHKVIKNGIRILLKNQWRNWNQWKEYDWKLNKGMVRYGVGTKSVNNQRCKKSIILRFWKRSKINTAQTSKKNYEGSKISYVR